MSIKSMRMECLKLAANVACSRQLDPKVVTKFAQDFYDFVMADDDEVNEPEDAVEYVGNHPRNLTHILNGKQIWPKEQEIKQPAKGD